MSVYAERKEGLLTFLMGMADPSSPVSLLDTHVLRMIGALRCESVPVYNDHDRQKMWCDPDDNRLLHRGFPDVDMPAIEYANGRRDWFIGGSLNRRLDKPAVICADGTREWFRNGRQHRDGDLPAVEYADGTCEWWKKDRRHRDGDLPAVEYADGTREWWRDGRRYRDGDLPAVEW